MAESDRIVNALLRESCLLQVGTVTGMFKFYWTKIPQITQITQTKEHGRPVLSRHQGLPGSAVFWETPDVKPWWSSGSIERVKKIFVLCVICRLTLLVFSLHARKKRPLACFLTMPSSCIINSIDETSRALRPDCSMIVSTGLGS